MRQPEPIDMVKKEKIGVVNTQGFHMTLKETCPYHIGGLGKIIQIKKAPDVMFDMDTLIQQLQNAREILRPGWEEKESVPDYDNTEERWRVWFYENNPCIVLDESIKDPYNQPAYAIAPTLVSTEGTPEWFPKETEE